MQTNKEAEQVTLSDLGICCGKTFREPSPVERPKARTSASSSKRSSELSAVPFMSLDLTPGHGNLLGESYWELISPWLGGAWMLNTGVSPNDARESSLSQILQDAPPIKYYLSPKACLGILRRASERGKALPPKLERALKIQAGLMCPDGQPTDLNAFHINQRDEGIDLHGVSGALMATTNMQMQTFVTQPDDTVEGFDGYNGDLTGDVAATLGVNCGMSTGRNGVMAFAANQRDEVRDLHDIAGALNAQLGMKQQTFVAAAFSAGAGASAGSIGYGEELAPTLKGSASGNCMPSVLCLNDQGGSVMECSEDVSGTLRAQEHHATRSQFASGDDKWRKLLDHLKGKEITSAGHLSAQNFSFGEEIIELDGKLNFYLQADFDVDAAFGTFVCTDQNDDWLNIYANYDVDQDRLCNTLDLNLCKGDGSQEDWSYPLNAAEQEVLLCKMEVFCQQQTGMSLHEYARQLRDSETQAPEMQM